MLLFDQNNETLIFFEPKTKFSEIYRQFRSIAAVKAVHQLSEGALEA